MFVEHAGDRDAVAGISGAWPGRVGGAVGAYLSRVPNPAEVVLIAQLSYTVRAGAMPVPAGPRRCQTG